MPTLLQPHQREGGKVLQVALIEDAVFQSFAAGVLIPGDDTVPQSGEGAQLMSGTFTPLSATSTLHIEVLGNFTMATAAGTGQATVMMALFKDSDASALASVLEKTFYQNGSGIHPLTLAHKLVPGSTALITFKVRVGQEVAFTTWYTNGQVSRELGGSMKNTIRITEIAS